jgi:hypothetical protein
MRRALSALLVLVPAFVGSCAVPVPDAGPAPATADGAARDAKADADTDDVVDVEEDAEPAVPSATFASIDALCAEQMKMVVPRLRETEKQWAERGETVDLAPRCRVSEAALAEVPVSLRAPFLEVRAIEVETGTAKQTHLAIRTAAGWFALGRASITSHHEDPGCFSIERDSGIVAVRVEGTRVPALVVVESSARGAIMEEEEEEPSTSGGHLVHMVTWDDVTQRARACRAEASGYVACDAPSPIRIERIPSTTDGDRKAELRFASESKIDDKGHLRITPVASTPVSPSGSEAL